ncbi:hypothetical protein GAMM_10054 [Gammaproteobacteria bacterium]
MQAGDASPSTTLFFIYETNTGGIIPKSQGYYTNKMSKMEHINYLSRGNKTQ